MAERIKDYFVYAAIGIASMTILADFGLKLYSYGQRTALKKIPSQLEITISRDKDFANVTLHPNNGEGYDISTNSSKPTKLKCDLQPKFKCYLSK
ncbi:MAG: hypothetical protein WC413_00780 [Candidatus Nanoarchaeia archaeon]